MWSQWWSGHGSRLHSQVGEAFQFIGELKSGWLISYQGNQQGGVVHASLPP